MKDVSGQRGGWGGLLRSARELPVSCMATERSLGTMLPLPRPSLLQYPGFNAGESVYKTRWMPPAQPFGMWGEA